MIQHARILYWCHYSGLQYLNPLYCIVVRLILQALHVVKCVKFPFLLMPKSTVYIQTWIILEGVFWWREYGLTFFGWRCSNLGKRSMLDYIFSMLEGKNTF